MKILIADDDAVSRRLLEGTLTRSGHEVVSVGDGQSAISLLVQPNAPRLAIVDWMMPGADGLAVCREVRSHADAYVYLILLTAREGQEDKVAALDAGADDFITKPVHVEELRARIRCGARILDLQEGLLSAQEQLRTLALRDHLTGLWNRRAVLEQLSRELNRVRHERRPLSVLLADIDAFKAVNDGLGHVTGDEVLRETASRLSAELREYDSIGRYGGEEFLFLLPGCDSAAAHTIADRLRQSIAATPIRISTGETNVTISIGVATTHAGGIDEPSALIRVADEALYRAKSAGRNRVVGA